MTNSKNSSNAENAFYIVNSVNFKKFVKSLQVICTRDSAKVLNPSLCLNLLFYLLNCSVKIWCWSRYANNVKFFVKTWYEFYLSVRRKSFDFWRWQTPQNPAQILSHNIKIKLVSQILKTKAQKWLWKFDKEMFCSVAVKQSMIRHKSIRPFKLHLK